MPERTPWWLLLLRMLALAAAILAFAGPVLNPRPAGTGDPLLVLIDGGWGDAPDWARRMDRAAAALDEAARTGRPAAVVTHGGAAAGRRGAAVADRRRSGASGWRGSRRWPGRRTGRPGRRGSRRGTGAFETLWLEDGIGHGGEAELARALLEHGPVTVVAPPADGAGADAAAARGRARSGCGCCGPDAGAPRPVGVMALGPDPNGIERVLGSATGEFAAGRGRARPRHRPAGRAAQPGGAGAARRRALGGGRGAGRRLGAAAQGRG